MLQKVADPFRVLDVGLPSGDVLHVRRIDDDGAEASLLQYVVEGLPVGCCALHCDHRRIGLDYPVREFVDLKCRRAVASGLPPLAVRDAGDQNLLVHVDAATASVEQLHIRPSLREGWRQTSSIVQFFIRPPGLGLVTICGSLKGPVSVLFASS